MQTKCERCGQCEIGIVTHDGHVFAAYGSGGTSATSSATPWAVRRPHRHDTTEQTVEDNLSQMGRTT